MKANLTQGASSSRPEQRIIQQVNLGIGSHVSEDHFAMQTLQLGGLGGQGGMLTSDMFSFQCPFLSASYDYFGVRQFGLN